MARKLHCLYQVHDDLHDFAEHVMNELTFATMNGEPELMRDFGGVQTSVLHRDGPYQVELVVVAPGLVIPPHVHPGTDSIEIGVSGLMRFTIDGEEPHADIEDDGRLMVFLKGKGLRIPATAVHGGVAHKAYGAKFLSVQRWEGPQTFIGNNYVGQGVSGKHEEVLRGR